MFAWDRGNRKTRLSREARGRMRSRIPRRSSHEEKEESSSTASPFEALHQMRNRPTLCSGGAISCKVALVLLKEDAEGEL